MEFRRKLSREKRSGMRKRGMNEVDAIEKEDPV
jgi:hypothetical protein